MIQDTPWTPPFVSTTSATAASNAETIAGTIDSKFVTPLSLVSAVESRTASTLAAQRNALAPAQALSFNGTAGSTIANVPAFGTGDFSVAATVNVSAIGAVQAFVGGAANSFAISVDAAGYIYARKTGVANLATSTIAIAAGRVVNIAYTRSGTTGTYYINGVAAGTVTDAQDYSVACAQLGSTAGTQFLTGTLRLLGITNRALSAAEVLSLYQTGSWPSSDFNSASNTAVYSTDFAADTGWTHSGGSTISGGKFNLVNGGAPYTSFTQVAGKKYKFTITVDSLTGTDIKYWNGAAYVIFATGAGTYTIEYTAAGNDTIFRLAPTGGNAVVDTFSLYRLGLLVASDWSGYTGGPQVIDVSGNGADLNLPGDGVSGGVVPTLPGATPSPFRATRTSSGYLIGDQVVIPPGCSVEIWAKGDGTFSLGDSSGTPASIVNAQTAPAALSPIAQAGYVTATRKLYLTLGTASTVTVRVNFKAA